MKSARNRNLIIIVGIILLITLPFHYIPEHGKVFPKDNLTFSNTFIFQKDIDAIIKRYNNANFLDKLMIRKETLVKKLLEKGIISQESEAKDASEAKDRYPVRLPGYINDFASVISSSERLRITNILTELERKTSAEVVIVTVPSIEGVEINIYKNGLFKKWKIGKKEKDNGVLIVLAIKERKIGIEVGYGIEGALSDKLCEEIIRKQMAPNFKAGQFGKGFVNAVSAIATCIAKEY